MELVAEERSAPGASGLAIQTGSSLCAVWVAGAAAPTPVPMPAPVPGELWTGVQRGFESRSAHAGGTK